MPESLPLTSTFDLGTVTEPQFVTLAPSAETRARIAKWAGLEDLPSLRAELRLSRAGDDFYIYDAKLEADLVQSCVVTLDPVPNHIERSFTRRFRIVRRRRGQPDISQDELPEDGDEVETVTHPVIDLAVPVLEELSLATDPYPRAPGAVFVDPVEDQDKAANPFAVLKGLSSGAGRKPVKSRKS
jgi:uncharacterized metal-binding protein YceD (DUF177 family)